MLKVDIVFTKEDMTEYNIDANKIVVVLDILLATSTIVSCLAAQAKAIYPVVNKHEAFSMLEKLKHQQIDEADIFLAGEENALVMDGFLNPVPSLLQQKVRKKHLILLTTNGTLAIRKAEKAKAILISSLLNTKAVAEKMISEYVNANIMVVCSGSNGSFCLEDFYGAGYLIDQITTLHDSAFLSDGALTAKLFYQGYQHQGEAILAQSAVGKLLRMMDLHADLALVSKKDLYNIVPEFLHGSISQ